MHGGLSPELNDFDVYSKIKKPFDVLEKGLICDLLWSDPSIENFGWEDNDRGVSYVFGPDVVNNYVKKLNIDLICRAH